MGNSILARSGVKVKRKTLITKCNYPWGDFSPTHAINHYLGCAFNCNYCWARDVWWKRIGGHLSKVWGVPRGFKWRRPHLFSNVGELLFTELPRLQKDARVLLCSTTDPYQPLDQHLAMTQYILRCLQEQQVSILVLTKAASLARRDFHILAEADAWFGVTMERAPTTPGGPYYARKVNLIKAHRQGIRTFVSLEPWIPGVDASEIVKDMADFVDHWIVGPLNYKGVDGQFYRENLGTLLVLFDKLGASYYIKPDLMRYMEKWTDETFT